MKKLLIFLITAAVFICTHAVAAYAETDGSVRIIDNDELFSSDEIAQLQGNIEALSEKYNIDIVLLTTSSLDYFFTADQYVDAWYEANCGENALILMIYNARDSYSRTYTSLGYGSCYYSVGNYFFDCIPNKSGIEKKLSNEKFFEACTEYYKLADRFLAEAEKGTPFGSEHMYFPMKYAVIGSIIALAVIVIGVLIYMEILRHRMKPVKRATQASEYVNDGSFRLEKSYDIYLYSNVVKTKIESSSGSAARSSGSSGGGGGGTRRF